MQEKKDFEEELRSGDIGEVKKTADDMERSIDDVRAVHTRGTEYWKARMEGKRSRDENLFENPEWVKKEYHASQGSGNSTIQLPTDLIEENPSPSSEVNERAFSELFRI